MGKMEEDALMSQQLYSCKVLLFLVPADGLHEFLYEASQHVEAYRGGFIVRQYRLSPE